MKKTALRELKGERLASALGGTRPIVLDAKLRVDIISDFVPHGLDTVQRQEFRFEHTTGRVYTPEELAARAADLMRDCAASGVDITIERKSKWPWRMGNTYPVIHIKQSYRIIRKIMQEYNEAQEQAAIIEQARREAGLDKAVPRKK